MENIKCIEIPILLWFRSQNGLYYNTGLRSKIAMIATALGSNQKSEFSQAVSNTDVFIVRCV